MIPPAIATNRRVFLALGAGPAGKLAMRLSLMPPDMSTPAAVLIVRGQLPDGWPVEVDLVVDPSQDPTLRGPGPTADQIAAAVAAWLKANPPAPGKDAVAPTVAIGKVTTLVAGKPATVTNSGSATALVLDFGIPAGPAGATLLGTAALIDRATVALSAGVRGVTITGIAGLKAGDGVVLVPVATLPAGYAITSAVSTADGTLTVTLVAPLLAAGGTTTIAVKIFRLNT